MYIHDKKIPELLGLELYHDHTSLESVLEPSYEISPS